MITQEGLDRELIRKHDTNGMFTPTMEDVILNIIREHDEIEVKKLTIPVVRNFFSVEGGCDWYDASVDYFVNLTDRTGENVYREYKESGGFHGNGGKWFRDWSIGKGYMRDPSDSELETYRDDF